MKLALTRTAAIAAGAAAIGVVVLLPRASRGEDQPAPVPAPPGAKILFDGSNLSQWVSRGDRPAPWKIEDGVATAGGGDIETREKFQNFYLHVEFMTPYMPDKHGQARGNSGVYLQGRYEIQVLDSYGKPEPGTGDCAAVYGQSAALVNACRPPLRWQTYDIVYRAPRYHDGQLVEKARVTVLQNGVAVQNNTEIQGGTTAGHTGEPPQDPGPIMLQDHGNPVKYRNVWIVPLPEHGASKYE